MTPRPEPHPPGDRGPGSGAPPIFHRVLDATLANIRQALTDMRARFQGRTDEDALARLELVLAEVLNNIALHGDDGRPAAGALSDDHGHDADRPDDAGRGPAQSDQVSSADRALGRADPAITQTDAGARVPPRTWAVPSSTSHPPARPDRDSAADGGANRDQQDRSRPAGTVLHTGPQATAAAPATRIVIHLTVTQHGGGLACAVVDDGTPLPQSCLVFPDQLPAPEISAMRAGGFGWYIIRDLTRSLFYFREGSRNILCFNIPCRDERQGRPVIGAA